MREIVQALEPLGIDPAAVTPLRETDRGTLWQLTCPGGKAAVDFCRRLQTVLRPLGHWPVLLGSTDELVQWNEIFDDRSTTVSAILTSAAKLDGQRLLEERDRERRSELAELNEGEDINGMLPKLGEWPQDPTPGSSFMLPFNVLTRKPHPRVAIALVSTPLSWEAPAFLNIGAWNECPAPEVHVALMRRWN